jgi:hypothetical protein
VINSEIGPLDFVTAAKGYLRHGRALHDNEDLVWNREDPDRAAYDAVRDAIRDAPADIAWGAVHQLLRLTPDEELGFVAAGSLEDLVHLRGAEIVALVEAEADRDPRFRWALGCIWLSRGELPDDVLARIVHASGNAIRLFPPLSELED